MTFDEWWDTTKTASTPDTYMGWEQSCRQAWQRAQLVERERCAQAVEQYGGAWDAKTQNFARLIRGLTPNVGAKRQ